MKTSAESSVLSAELGKGAPTQRKFTEEWSERFLKALTLLQRDYRPHPCGGFTSDDIEWRLGVAFLLKEEIEAALDELQEAKLIRYCGFDEDDAIGHCYEVTP